MHEYDDQDALVHDLTSRLSLSLNRLIAERGKASVALSGGSTPQSLYEALSRQVLPWQSVNISLVDERWVDEMHPESNARFIKNTLIQNHASGANFIGMKTSNTDAFAAEQNLGSILARHILPLDLVLLGMGLDGHTASLFPGAAGLDRALSADCRNVCCAIQPQTGDTSPMPQAGDAKLCARMTLSLNTLLSAQQRILYITGEAKRHVLENAFTPGPVEDMPVRAVLHDSQTLTEIYYAPDS
ncbi:MAG: 6-phosphogluconolactonase [Pseudohongiella sp.]|uniref:6-phosphogluconolactonase n=1 Tax=Pseudohongiella sp. TaxID=1979412 RepID=UPI0034A00A73